MYTPYMLIYAHTSYGWIYKKLVLMRASGEEALRQRTEIGRNLSLYSFL